MSGTLMQPRGGGLLALAAVLVVVPWFLPNRFYFDVAILAGINAIVVVGLNLLIGYAGQISLGHAGFFGLGAYASAVLPQYAGIDPLLALAIGAVVVSALAYLIGGPILRLRGHYLAMATLGLGILVFLVISNERQFTGGPDGMIVERISLFGWRLTGTETWYWLVAAVLFVVVAITLNLIESPTGRAMRALHDSEVAAQTHGIDIDRYKLTAFVISALFASVAGSMSALYSGFVTPDKASFLHSIVLVTMVVLGGMGSTYGGLIGAVVLTALPQFLTVVNELQDAMYGLLLMAVMIVMPRGLLPSLRRMLQRLRWRLRGSQEAAP